MTRTRKLAFAAALFAAALVCVALASASRSVGPLFLAWVPLLSVPYLLTRTEPGQGQAGKEGESGSEGDASPSPNDSGPDEPRPVDDGPRGGTEGDNPAGD